MNVKKFSLILLLSFILTVVYSQTKNAEKPNVLFIAIDDMNDWTGFLGGHPQAKTPNMDELARKGVNFTNAHTVVPGCSPSRNALMFGIEPYESGLYPFYRGSEIVNVLQKKYTSLARLFKENGYMVYGAGKIHPCGTTKTEWNDYFKFDKSAVKPILMKEFGYFDEDRDMPFCPIANPYSELHDYQVASYGVNILEQNHDNPFFLGVGIVKPHLPFICPKEFFDEFPEEIVPPPVKADDHNDIPWAGRVLSKINDDYHFSKDNAWNDVRRAYLACIYWADYNIGRVLDALEKSPYADNTIIVLWSDHGYHLGEKRSFRKFTLWEESTRIPFIIYDPRNKSAKGDCSKPVSLINVYRTLTEMVGLEAPGHVMGNSLVPLMNNVNTNVAGPALTTWGRGNYTLRSDNFRYIRYFDGSEEFYNHKNDPNEWNNIAEDPSYTEEKEKIMKFLPENEVKMFPLGIKPGSVAGADNPEAVYKGKKMWDELKNKILPPLPD